MSRKRKLEVFEDVLGQGSSAAVLREAARTITSYVRALAARLSRARRHGDQYPRFAFNVFWDSITSFQAVPRYVRYRTANDDAFRRVSRSEANWPPLLT